MRMQKLSQEAMSFTTLSGMTRKAAAAVASSCCKIEQSHRACEECSQEYDIETSKTIMNEAVERVNCTYAWRFTF